jgi:hypothetical protein
VTIDYRHGSERWLMHSLENQGNAARGHSASLNQCASKVITVKYVPKMHRHRDNKLKSSKCR